MNRKRRNILRRSLIFCAIVIMAAALESCGLFKENCDCPRWSSQIELEAPEHS